MQSVHDTAGNVERDFDELIHSSIQIRLRARRTSVTEGECV